MDNCLAISWPVGGIHAKHIGLNSTATAALKVELMLETQTTKADHNL